MNEQEAPEPSPYQPARSAETQVRRRRGTSPFWVVLGAAGIILMLVYGAGKLMDTASPDAAPATEVSRDTDPGIDGIIARDAPASQFVAGDCLTDFEGPLDRATIVTCRTPHTAQLIGIARLDDTPYPGDARTATKAEAACKAIRLDPAALSEGAWTYEFSSPSQGTWAAGDRNVACFLTLAEGTVGRSMLPAASGTA